MDKASIVNQALLTLGVDQSCCQTWAAAHGSGTDNEGYEALISKNRIGYDLPPVKFCPWCGAPKSTD